MIASQDGRARRRRGWRWWTRFALVNVAVAGGFFLLLEGVAGVTLVVQRMRFRPLAERVYTEYDPELGWISKARYHHPDLYGPGLSLRTNAQRVRNARDFEREPPHGRTRILCTGDSFTLGYGVADGDTWVARLEALDPRLQTVNMGQGGYGLDQAYLWFDRIKDELEHDIHVFAVIIFDLRRMIWTDFLGYGKPILRLEEGELRVDNVPVPRTSYSMPWMGRNLDTLRDLASVRLLRQIVGEDDDPPTENEHREVLEDTLVAMLHRLHEYHRSNDSHLVVAYLPTKKDLGDLPIRIGGRDPESWRRFLQEQATQQGFRFVDLVEEFRDLDVPTKRALFIRPSEVDYPGAEGHYSSRGNALVARALHRRLLALPEIAARIGERAAR